MARTSDQGSDSILLRGSVKKPIRVEMPGVPGLHGEACGSRNRLKAELPTRTSVASRSGEAFDPFDARRQVVHFGKGFAPDVQHVHAPELQGELHGRVAFLVIVA